MEQPRGNALSRTKAAAGRRWAGLKSDHPAVADLVAGWGAFQQRNGGQFAGAITFFSFLALFPLLLLVVAVVGFVLHSHPAAQATLFHKIETSVSGTLGQTLKASLQSAINARTGLGVVGLLGVLFTGLGWIGNLRAAIDAMWATRPAQRNFLMTRVVNLGVLIGLGLGSLVAIGLSAVSTSLTDQILHSLGGGSGLHWLIKIAGIAVSLLGYMLIFGWVLIRLPRITVARSLGLRGALFAAVGFEVLTVLGTYTIAKTAHSPTAGPFAGLVAILVWIKLVAQLLLYVAAWMAVVTARHEAEAAAEAERSAARPVTLEPDEPAPTVSAAAVAGSLLGVGAAAGAAAVAWASRRHDRAGSGAEPGAE